jgi:hypothetical protein
MYPSIEGPIVLDFWGVLDQHEQFHLGLDGSAFELYQLVPWTTEWSHYVHQSKFRDHYGSVVRQRLLIWILPDL